MDERRYYGLDALLGGMMILGSFLHAAMFSLIAPPTPVPTDPDTAGVFDVFVLLYPFLQAAGVLSLAEICQVAAFALRSN